MGKKRYRAIFSLGQKTDMDMDMSPVQDTRIQCNKAINKYPNFDFIYVFIFSHSE